MGIFFTSPEPALPTITSAFAEALSADPTKFANIRHEAADRAVHLAKALAPRFNPWRFGGAVVIAVLLLVGAIWTGENSLPDISKSLMTSFQAFSGLVAGLLGGEAQKSTSG